MSLDRMESIVSDLESLDYPGRRKPVNRGTAKKTVVDIPVWSDRPFRYTLGGETRNWYVISHLAKALDCSVQSIRSWQEKGLMPLSGYRSPSTKGKPQAAGSRKGKRIWTYEQIEGIVRLARRHRVILNKKPPTAAFARDVGVMFDRLRSSNQ